MVHNTGHDDTYHIYVPCVSRRSTRSVPFPSWVLCQINTRTLLLYSRLVGGEREEKERESQKVEKLYGSTAADRSWDIIHTYLVHTDHTHLTYIVYTAGVLVYEEHNTAVYTECRNYEVKINSTGYHG